MTVEYEKPGLCEERGKQSSSSAGMGGSFSVWGVGILRWLRGSGGFQCLLAWLCVAFSFYWIAYKLKALLILLKVNVDYVLWGGILGGVILQVLCYVGFRCGCRLILVAPFLFPGKGRCWGIKAAGGISLFIRMVCGLSLLLWPLFTLVVTFLLFREVNCSSGQLLGILKESLVVWCLPVFVLVILVCNYLLFDLLCIKVSNK